jgi:hypothetical protein
MHLLRVLVLLNSGKTDLTVAFVPTGINAGVCICPCGVEIVPTRASESESLAVISNPNPLAMPHIVAEM